MTLLDLVLVTGIVVGCFTLASWKTHYPSSLSWLQNDRKGHLGAEYNNIAHAIIDGRGFSDPFSRGTGPTAWMPPVLPYVLAGVYRLSGQSEAVAVDFMISIQTAALLLTGLIVIHQARGLRLVNLGYVTLVCGFTNHFHQLFQYTHDSGWLLLLTGMLWLGVVRIWNGISTGLGAAVWGAFGGLCALSSPVIGMVWAVLTTVRLWPTKLVSDQVRLPATVSDDQADSSVKPAQTSVSTGQRIAKRFMPLVISASVSILAITPWTLRNRLVLGKWIPIKSNSMYEVWQSQCLGETGVIDGPVLGQHPWCSNGSQRQRYIEVGEMAFVAEKGALARQAIWARPLDFLSRVANRWIAACVYLPAFRVGEEGLGNGWPIWIKRHFYPLPLISVMVILATRRPLGPTVWATMAIGCLALLPYVLVSYYERYATPLVGVKMLLVLYGVHTLLHAGKGGTSRCQTEDRSAQPLGNDQSAPVGSGHANVACRGASATPGVWKSGR